jgi:hypothetical protein
MYFRFFQRLKIRSDNGVSFIIEPPSLNLASMHDPREIRIELTLAPRSQGKQLRRTPLGHGSVDGKEQHRTDHRHDEACRLLFLVQSDHPAEPGCDERPGDAEQDCNDETAGIFARHEKLRDCTDHQAY